MCVDSEALYGDPVAPIAMFVVVYTIHVLTCCFSIPIVFFKFVL